jgi:hypothetical protein
MSAMACTHIVCHQVLEALKTLAGDGTTQLFGTVTGPLSRGKPAASGPLQSELSTDKQLYVESK